MKIYNIDDSYKFIKMMSKRKGLALINRSSYDFYDDVRSLESLDRYNNPMSISEKQVYITTAEEGYLVFITEDDKEDGYTIYFSNKYNMCKGLIKHIIEQLY